MIKPLAHVMFMSKGLQMPTKEYKHPSGDAGPQYSRMLGFDPKIPSIDAGIPLFMPEDPRNMHHMDSKAKVGQTWRDFMDSACDAIAYGLIQWKAQAKFQNFIINGPSAMGPPGCLDGPDIENFVKNAPSFAALQAKDAASKLCAAVAKGAAKCLSNWQKLVTVPGLPLYPAFTAFPGPMAPPMPNVPIPLIACVSGMVTALMGPILLQQEMINAYDGGMKQKDKDKQHEAAFLGIATVASLAFTMWMPQQQVMLVLGKGQIPTFAPPYVPVGPVVAGDNIAAPGHTIA
jgi:hypothetical protein